MVLRNLIQKFNQWRANCRYQRCLREFEQLSPSWQTLFRVEGIDPEALKEKGKFSVKGKEDASTKHT